MEVQDNQTPEDHTPNEAQKQTPNEVPNQPIADQPVDSTPLDATADPTLSTTTDSTEAVTPQVSSADPTPSTGGLATGQTAFDSSAGSIASGIPTAASSPQTPQAAPSSQTDATAVIEEEEDIWADQTEEFGQEYGQEERAEWIARYEESLCDVAEKAIVQGTIKQLSEKYAIVDIGYKSEGLVHRSEFRDLDKVNVGDTIEVFVERIEDPTGNLLISRRKAKVLRSWERIQQAQENRSVIEGLVKRRTKGGLVLDIYGIEAFLPGSQIDVRPIKDFDAYVGRNIEVMVVKINYTNDNVVVSHKMLIEQDIEEQKTEILHKLEKGQIVEGKVKNITNFGAFIDLGGIDGLLHITDISWGRISHPEEVLEVNSTIKVVVLDFDDEKKRISLGKKHLEKHPWDSIPELTVGTKLQGKVSNITDYGAFVEIRPGVEGLVHVSEMSWSQSLRSPADLFKVGDEIEVVVLSLDREDHKMGLGTKQLTENPWERAEFAEKYTINSRHTGKICNLVHYGLFVELEEGIEALMHISDISWTKKIKNLSTLYKKGDQIEGVILDVDTENHRLSLSHKHLEDDPWDELETIFPKGSIHECTVISVGKVLILELPYGLEGICYTKYAAKEDGSLPKAGEVLPFAVNELSREEQRIVLSHLKTHQGNNRSKKTGAPPTDRITQQEINKVNQESKASTLGDLGALSNLQSKINNEDEDA